MEEVWILKRCFEHGTRRIRNDWVLFLLLDCGAMSSGSDHTLRSKETPHATYTAKGIYGYVAGFALKMPLNLSRYCRKTRIHNTQATSAGVMVPGAIVR